MKVSNVENARMYKIPCEFLMPKATAAAADASNDTFEFIASTEYPMPTWYGGKIVVLHREGSINVERAMSVGAILKNHDPNIIVAKFEELKIDAALKRLVGRGRWLKTPAALEAKQEWEEGALRGISIGWLPTVIADVDPGEEYEGIMGPAEVHVKSDLLEVSVTPIPRNPEAQTRPPAGGSASAGDSHTSAEAQEDEEMKLKPWQMMAMAASLLYAPDSGGGGGVAAPPAPGTAPVVPTASQPTNPTPPVQPVVTPQAAAQPVQQPTAPARVDTAVIDGQVNEAMIFCQIAGLSAEDTVAIVNRVTSGLATATQIRAELQAHRSAQPQVAAVGSVAGARVGEDAIEKLFTAATVAMRLRAGADLPATEAQGLARELAGLSALDMYRQIEVRRGRSASEVMNLSAQEAWNEIKRSRFAHSFHGDATLAGILTASGGAMNTSLFPLILANTVNKEMLSGYGAPEITYNQVSLPDTLPDFKSKSLIKLSEPPRLIAADEDDGVKYFRVSESGESYQLAEYKGGLKFTERLLINDDMGALLESAREMGMWISIQVDESFWSYWLSNPDLTDGVDFFHADHGNYIEGAGTVLGTDGLIAARKNFRLRVGMRGKDKKQQARRIVSVTPKLLIVGPTLEDTAQVLTTARTRYGQDNPEVPNTAAKGLVPLFVPYLEHPDFTGTSTTAWYLTAARELGFARTGFLRGNVNPIVDSMVDFDDDCFKVKYKHRWAHKLHRPEYTLKSKGAA